MAGRADGARQIRRRAAHAAADIDDVFAGPCSGGGQGVLAEIGDRTLDALVVGREPALPARAVPERGLFGSKLRRAFHASAADLATTSSRGM